MVRCDVRKCPLAYVFSFPPAESRSNEPSPRLQSIGGVRKTHSTMTGPLRQSLGLRRIGEAGMRGIWPRDVRTKEIEKLLIFETLRQRSKHSCDVRSGGFDNFDICQQLIEIGPDDGFAHQMDQVLRQAE